MNHALITGGAGFIGSHLVDSLLSDGWRVTAIDNFDAFYDRGIKEENIEGHRAHPGYRFEEVDICDYDRLHERFSGCRYDAIVHLAAKAGVRPSILDPRAYQRVNAGGTQHVLELARVTGTRQFVFASSSSVYGVNPSVPWREDDHGLLPISPYAGTKVAGELMGHVYSYLYGIRFLALRFFTVYGPRQRPDLAIHKMARLMLEGKPIPVYGDGSARRDYTYIADIVAGIKSAIGYTGSQYEIFNLGNNHTVGLHEMIQGLENVLGCEAKIKRLPPQAGDVPITWADLDKSNQRLGYRPETTFPDGLRRFARWLELRPVPAATIGSGQVSRFSEGDGRR